MNNFFKKEEDCFSELVGDFLRVPTEINCNIWAGLLFIAYIAVMVTDSGKRNSDFCVMILFYISIAIDVPGVSARHDHLDYEQFEKIAEKI